MVGFRGGVGQGVGNNSTTFRWRGQLALTRTKQCGRPVVPCRRPSPFQPSLQDPLIEFMRTMHATHTSEEVMAKMERWVAEHRADPVRSRLRRLIPGVGAFFTPLGLVQALREYDEFFALSRRVYVPPNFAELRHVLNIAQVGARGGRGLFPSTPLPPASRASAHPPHHPHPPPRSTRPPPTCAW